MTIDEQLCWLEKVAATYHFVVVDINEHFIEVSSITTKGKILDNLRINK